MARRLYYNIVHFGHYRVDLLSLPSYVCNTRYTMYSVYSGTFPLTDTGTDMQSAL